MLFPLGYSVSKGTGRMNYLLNYQRNNVNNSHDIIDVGVQTSILILISTIIILLLIYFTYLENETLRKFPTCSVSQLVSSRRFKFLFNITMCPQVKFTFAQRWVSMSGLHLFAQHRYSLLLNYSSTRLQQQLPGLWIPYGAGCCPRTTLMAYPTTSLLLAAMRYS